MAAPALARFPILDRGQGGNAAACDHAAMTSARSVLFFAAIVLMAASADAGAGKASQARGAALVEQWCRDCHLRPGDKPDADMAPAYEDIVTWPGRDRAYLRKFLRDDHFPMSTYRLFDDEKRDVLDWLMSLKPRP